MKHINLFWVPLAMFVISGCDVSPTASPSAVKGEAPIDFSGNYTLGGACDALIGTMSVGSESIRVSETVCQISSTHHINTSNTEYVLKSCQAEGTPDVDRTVNIYEFVDGKVVLSGWGKQDFTFDICG